MKVMESGEDYLETILILQMKGNPVRSVDVAEAMNVSRASVSVAMKNLKQGGYIRMSDGYQISLTTKGKALAEIMYERHLLFSNVLSSLGVDRETAMHDACRMEHVLSAKSFRALKTYFVENGIARQPNQTALDGKENLHESGKISD